MRLGAPRLSCDGLSGADVLNGVFPPLGATMRTNLRCAVVVFGQPAAGTPVVEQTVGKVHQSLHNPPSVLHGSSLFRSRGQNLLKMGVAAAAWWLSAGTSSAHGNALLVCCYPGPFWRSVILVADMKRLFIPPQRVRQKREDPCSAYGVGCCPVRIDLGVSTCP